MRKLGNITMKAILSRFEQLAVFVEGIIDNVVHPEGELMGRGLLLGKITAGTVGTVGNLRAYAEGKVKTGGAFSTGAATFTLDPADSATKAMIKHFRIGDVIESTGGTALGTILTYNPVTGVGTLTGNSSNNLAAGQGVRVAAANLKISGKAGMILKDEVLMEATNEPVVGYIEGFFKQSSTTVTAAAATSMNGTNVTSDELRLV